VLHDVPDVQAQHHYQLGLTLILYPRQSLQCSAGHLNTDIGSFAGLRMHTCNMQVATNMIMYSMRRRCNGVWSCMLRMSKWSAASDVACRWAASANAAGAAVALGIAVSSYAL
jgi:hypothetical protein